MTLSPKDGKKEGDGPVKVVEAYRRVAELCRKQKVDVAKSGWFFFEKRCAQLNLDGIAKVCDAWAEEALAAWKEAGNG